MQIITQKQYITLKVFLIMQNKMLWDENYEYVFHKRENNSSIIMQIYINGI